MTAHIIIVDRRTDFKWDDSGHPVVTAREYFSRPEAFMSRYPRIVNLCRDYDYLSYGYYCSLLAEARGERVIPSVATLLDLSRKSIYGLALDELDELLEKTAKKDAKGTSQPFTLHVYFGISEEERVQDLAHQIFDLFRCPLLKVQINPGEKWRVTSIEPVPVNEIKPEQEALFMRGLEAYTRVAWRPPKPKPSPLFYIAILHYPLELQPPSTSRSLLKFVMIGELLCLEVELI